VLQSTTKIILAALITFTAIATFSPSTADAGKKKQLVVVAGTFDVREVPAIEKLLTDNKIRVKSGGEFGIWFSVPQRKKLKAIRILDQNGYKDYIWRKPAKTE
jgi:hypothetical protein